MSPHHVCLRCSSVIRALLPSKGTVAIGAAVSFYLTLGTLTTSFGGTANGLGRNLPSAVVVAETLRYAYPYLWVLVLMGLWVGPTQAVHHGYQKLWKTRGLSASRASLLLILSALANVAAMWACTLVTSCAMAVAFCTQPNPSLLRSAFGVAPTMMLPWSVLSLLPSLLLCQFIGITWASATIVTGSAGAGFATAGVLYLMGAYLLPLLVGQNPVTDLVTAAIADASFPMIRISVASNTLLVMTTSALLVTFATRCPTLFCSRGRRS